MLAALLLAATAQATCPTPHLENIIGSCEDPASPNPQSYTGTPPLLGTTWSGFVDTNVHPGTNNFVVTSFSQNPACTTLTNFSFPFGGGAILLTGTLLATKVISGTETLATPDPSTGVAEFSFALPPDPSIAGKTFYTQAAAGTTAGLTLSNGLLFSPGLSFVLGPHPGPELLHRGHANFAPLTANVIQVGEPGEEFHVVYSARDRTLASQPNNPQLFNNSLISIFKLLPSEPADFLIFGTGYGCRYRVTANGSILSSTYDVTVDVAMVDEVIRGCHGFESPEPDKTKIDIVAPHGHGDHINPEFIEALEATGKYEVSRVFVHVDDSQHLQDNITDTDGGPCGSFGTLHSDFPTLLPIGSSHPSPGPCNTSCSDLVNYNGALLEFQSDLGAIWFRHRANHTRGSIDLILDFSPSERWMVAGSNYNQNAHVPTANGGCGPNPPNPAAPQNYPRQLTCDLANAALNISSDHIISPHGNADYNPN